MKVLAGILLAISSFLTHLQAQEIVLYKQVDSARLFLEVFHPDIKETATSNPAIVFFFGGGWNGGGRQHFVNHARYLSQRGMVCFLADYRTKKSHQATPFDCLKDAKSAVRFIRAHAEDFGIDPDRLVAAGGSAGGHLAAATALTSGFNQESDDTSISCVPNALVLYNPVIDNGPGGYGYERISEAYKEFSPLHNISRGAPPTIIFLGTEDKLIPVSTVEYYRTVMEKVGSRCEVKLYEGQAHGFFNYRNFEYYKQTLTETDFFLQSLGYLNAKPTLEIK